MTNAAAWNAVFREADRLQATHLRELFDRDADRFARFSLALDDLTVDVSKEKLDQAAWEALLELARAAGVEDKRDAMFAGVPINATEGRSVLHMALRGGADAPAEVGATLDRFLAFADEVRSGAYRAEAGAFDDVVSIGIGGSDLGPDMAVRALHPDCNGPRLHFVSNVDGAHLGDVVQTLDPKRTLIIISSKTFSTAETMVNARSARCWLEVGGVDPKRHLVAVSVNVEACEAFGIDRSRVFGFWDWVGGRYSLWSAIGLPLAIGIGADRFRAFLAGAAVMDRHFREAPLAENLPVLLGLIGIWRRNAMGWPVVSLIPYDQRLARFPAYVQQLDMESNGKRICLDGTPSDLGTGPVVFGEPGTNAQHSFFQLLHQGTDIIPVDFIIAARSRGALVDHHRHVLANCFAQGQALAFGRTEAEARAEMAAQGLPSDGIDRLAPHRSFPGDRPSTTILYRCLDPFALGRLIALFEHKVFVQGVIWGINSFDQWGVELGKELANALGPVIAGEDVRGLDDSTRGLVQRSRELAT